MILGRVRLTPGGGSPPTPPFDTTGLDTNTLVTSDVRSFDWRENQYLASAPTVDTYTDTDGTFGYINQAQNASGNGVLYNKLILPVGCTSADLKVTCKAPPGVSGESFTVGLFTPSGFVGTPLSISPTSTLTTYTLSYTGLTAGAQYAVVFIVNLAGYSTTQARALVQSVVLSPVGASAAPFNGTFYRFLCNAVGARTNAEPAKYEIDTYRECLLLASPCAHWDVLTDATSFAAEYSANDTDYPPQTGVWIESGGAVAQTLLAGGAVYKQDTFSLASGSKTVSIFNAPVHDGSDGATPGSPVLHGCWPRCLYVGASTVLQVQGATTTPPRFLVYGDSISVGYKTSLGLHHWSILRRAGRAQSILKGWGSRSLHDDGLDATARTAFVASLANASTFDRIYLAIGRNDYALAKWSASAFGTAYADLLDKLHAAYPTLPIYAQTPIPSTTEGANSLGDDMPAYRSAIASACSGKAWVTFIDGTTLASLSDLDADGVHLTDTGAPNVANAIGTAVGV